VVDFASSTLELNKPHRKFTQTSQTSQTALLTALANHPRKYSNFLPFYLRCALTLERMNVGCAHIGTGGSQGAANEQSQHPGNLLHGI